MKKFIILALLFEWFTLSITAKTRYFAFNNIQVSYEIYDSLGNDIPMPAVNTTNSMVVEDFGFFTFGASCLPTSDDESKSIKRIKNARGWAMVGAIASATSAGLNAAQSGHLGWRGLYHHTNMHLDLMQMNRFSSHIAALDSKLASINLTTGKFVWFKNNTMKPLTFWNGNIISVIAPKDIIVFNIADAPAKFTFKTMDGGLIRIHVQLTREVKKQSYDFEMDGIYYKGPMYPDNGNIFNPITGHRKEMDKDEYKEHKQRYKEYKKLHNR